MNLIMMMMMILMISLGKTTRKCNVQTVMTGVTGNAGAHVTLLHSNGGYTVLFRMSHVV
jgi:hypothetical protein